MKITKVEQMRVFVPWQDSYKEPMVSWRGMSGTTPEEEDSYVIVQVHTDEGIVGIGEGGRSMAQTEQQAQAVYRQESDGTGYVQPRATLGTCFSRYCRQGAGGTGLSVDWQRQA